MVAVVYVPASCGIISISCAVIMGTNGGPSTGSCSCRVERMAGVAEAGIRFLWHRQRHR